ncbi:MAG TPA: ABC transporter ATP-binding protein [Vulgatibacter sp.]|nr:ABC transporter ATP-binding protein [Vulgatibacter sp.]
MIRLREIRKSYPDGERQVEVLRGASLHVGEGELVAVMGASGSGKSTLLNVIGGLDRAYRGAAEVLGRDLARLTERELARHRNEGVGFVFQSFNLLAPLDALHNVMLPSFFGPRAAFEDARARAAEALARVGLSGKEGRLPSRLSGGERQRVALARALFARPRILLADEPTGSLDAETADQVLEVLRDLNGRERLTVVLVTHDDRVAALAGRRLRLRDGILEPAPEEARG